MALKSDLTTMFPFVVTWSTGTSSRFQQAVEEIYLEAFSRLPAAAGRRRRSRTWTSRRMWTAGWKTWSQESSTAGCTSSICDAPVWTPTSEVPTIHGRISVRASVQASGVGDGQLLVLEPVQTPPGVG